MICEICSNSDKNEIHQVRDMMFGLGRLFTYLECSDCRSLQLVDPPRDVKNFYPPDYYSFRKVKHHGHSNFAKVALEKKRDRVRAF